MQTWEWVVIAVVLAGALVFTLAWWRLADKWADAEHRRFKPKGTDSASPPIVIRAPGAAAPPHEPSAPESAADGR